MVAFNNMHNCPVQFIHFVTWQPTKYVRGVYVTIYLHLIFHLHDVPSVYMFLCASIVLSKQLILLTISQSQYIFQNQSLKILVILVWLRCPVTKPGHLITFYFHTYVIPFSYYLYFLEGPVYIINGASFFIIIIMLYVLHVYSSHIYRKILTLTWGIKQLNCVSMSKCEKHGRATSISYTYTLNASEV